MQYSLLSRFQGAYLGAAIAEILSFGTATHPQSWLPGMITSTQALIATGTFPSETLIQGGILPLALLCHEDEELLHQHLQTAIIAQAIPSELAQTLTAIALTLTQILHNRLPLIEEILPNLEIFPPATPLKTSLEQSATLESVNEQLQEQTSPQVRSLLMGWYSFLSTPTEMRLSVLRTLNGLSVHPHHSPQDHPALIVTAMLSSAYNSRAGIPPEWQILINRHPQTNTLATLARQLLAHWSGLLIPEPLPSILPITAPLSRTLRSPQFLR